MVDLWDPEAQQPEFLHMQAIGDTCGHALEQCNPEDARGPRDQTGHRLPLLNVVIGEDLSILEQAKPVAATSGFSGPIAWDTTKPDSTPKKQLAVSRLAKVGWQAHIPLADELMTTVEPLRKKPKQRLVNP